MRVICKCQYDCRTEWVIFHEEMDIGGSIDFVYMDADGCLHIVDWKRTARIQEKMDNPWQAACHPSCAQMHIILCSLMG